MKNKMKNKRMLLAGLLVCIGLTSCDENDSTQPVDPSSFAVLCENSGGTYKDEQTCTCNGIDCMPNDVCNFATKTCPAIISPELSFADACTHTGGTPDGHYCTCDGKKQKEYETCTSPQSPDCDKCCESCGNCGGETCNFEDACKASGGDAAGGICVCNGVGCKKGVICNFDENESGDHVCADECLNDMCDFSKPVIGVNCSNDDSRCFATCENSNSVGKLLVCDSSKYVETVCKNDKNEEVSCKNDHSCGTCKNYTQLCENQINEAGEEIGAVIECQEGQPGKATALCKDVSCRTDIPACGECINGKLKCTEDTNNNAIMYRCVDGKWKRIENKLDPIDPG